MFSANPVIRRASDRVDSGAITFDGIIHRTGFLIVLAILGFAFSWQGLRGGIPGMTQGMIGGIALGGFIIGLILGLVISFTQICNPVVIGIYAVCQGLLLGAVSAVVEVRMPGIAFQTAATTFGLFLLVLFLYKVRILRATPIMTKIIIGGIIGVGVLYLVDAIGGLFGSSLSLIHGNGTGAILLSVAIVLLAAISFILDFAMAEQAVEDGVSEQYAWRIGFSLLVGLVWLYMEILRLLMKLRSRD
jgi:uncharacterized YccA/Bax inhibitor family protein